MWSRLVRRSRGVHWAGLLWLAARHLHKVHLTDWAARTPASYENLRFVILRWYGKEEQGEGEQNGNHDIVYISTSTRTSPDFRSTNYGSESSLSSPCMVFPVPVFLAVPVDLSPPIRVHNQTE